MTIPSDLIARARYAKEYGGFDSLHGELLDQLEFMEHEFEAERDRANEHFDARQDAECRLAALETVLAQVREAAEYWTTDSGLRAHLALRQGGHHILGLIERGAH